MRQTQTETAHQPQYAEVTSLLDMMEVRQAPAPVAVPSWLDTIEAPTGKYSRGRRIVMTGDVEVVRQDSDVLSVGGLFGMVEEGPAQAHHRMAQEGLFVAEQGAQVGRRGVCICGDERCTIGPFMGS